MDEPVEPSPPAAPTGATATQPPYGLFVSTMNDLPGYEIVSVLGTALGLAAFTSARYSGTQGASARYDAIARMCALAESWGANAVLAMRFDSAALGSLGTAKYEVSAYGTAVVVRPLPRAS